MSKTVKPSLIPKLKLGRTVVNPNPIHNLNLSENVYSPKLILTVFSVKQIQEVKNRIESQ